MHRVLSRDQIRSYDKIAMEKLHVPGVILMENAGRGAAEVIQSIVSNEPGHVLVVCGTGNNGGDGFVVARHLIAFGNEVSVVLLGEPDKLQGDALINHDAYLGIGGDVVIVADEGSLPVLETELRRSDFLVDAIFGTGLDREVEGRYAGAIDRMNATAATRIALDLPSGLDANTGAVLGTAVVADATITFGALKLGLLTPMGSRLAGEVHVAGLGVPASIIDETGHDAEVLVGSRIGAMVNRLREPSSLLDEGAVGIVVSSGREWAARLAAVAALRLGAREVILFGVPEAVARISDLAADTTIVVLDPKQPAKTLVKSWERCESVVFPVVGVDDLPLLKQTKKSFEGTLIAHGAEDLGARGEQLLAPGCDAALLFSAESLAMAFDVGEGIDNRFGVVRSAVEASGATIVLADSQPVVGVPGTALGVLGKHVVGFDTSGMRAIASGVMGVIACWSDASVAALGGLHLTLACIEAWSAEGVAGRAPRAAEIADTMAWRG